MHPALHQLRNTLGPLWWFSLLMFLAARIGDLINFYISMWLVPDTVAPERLGAILPLTQLSLFVMVPMRIAVAGGLKFITVFEQNGERGKVKTLMRDLLLFGLAFSILMLFSLWLSRDFIRERLRFESPTVIWLVAAIAVASCWTPLLNALAQATRRFYALIATRLIAPVARLVAMLLLLGSFQVAGYLSANLVACLATALFLLATLLPYWLGNTPRASWHQHRPEMLHYLAPIAVLLSLQALQGVVEPWVIRQRLPTESAAWYFLCSFGNIPLYLSAAIIPFFFPIVSDRFERGLPTHALHRNTLTLACALGLAVVLAFALWAENLFALRPAWTHYQDYARHLWKTALISTLHITLLLHLAHEQACRRHHYLPPIALFILLEVAILYGLNAWGLLQGILPEPLWRHVRDNALRSLPFTIHWILACRLLTLAAVLALFTRKRHA